MSGYIEALSDTDNGEIYSTEIVKDAAPEDFISTPVLPKNLNSQKVAKSIVPPTETNLKTLNIQNVAIPQPQQQQKFQAQTPAPGYSSLFWFIIIFTVILVGLLIFYIVNKYLAYKRNMVKELKKQKLKEEAAKNFTALFEEKKKNDSKTTPTIPNHNQTKSTIKTAVGNPDNVDKISHHNFEKPEDKKVLLSEVISKENPIASYVPPVQGNLTAVVSASDLINGTKPADKEEKSSIVEVIEEVPAKPKEEEQPKLTEIDPEDLKEAEKLVEMATGENWTKKDSKIAEKIVSEAIDQVKESVSELSEIFVTEDDDESDDDGEDSKPKSLEEIIKNTLISE
jgi:hypothetical protein